MDEELIRRWNAKVKPNDTVYHLGDFAMGKNSTPSILKKLNGNKHLIWGNHDSNQVRRDPHWKSSQPYLELTLGGHFIVLCHYKFEVYNRHHYGALQFYGHSHGSLPGNNQQLDVGVDCHDYYPITLNEALEVMKTLPPRKKVDHHGEN